VRDHDKAEITDLIVTIGAPDQLGNIHPSEEVFFDLMLSDPRQGSPPNHLRKVLAHGWETGRILEVHPQLRVVAPGRFQTTVPPHQLVVVG
jgi:hypothetical protein